MAQVHAQHPTSEQLRAFGLGRLSPDEQAWVEQHVEHCDTCAASLLSIPDDTLLNRLKDCDTSIPETIAGGHVSHRPDEPAAAVPPELQDHPRYRVVGRVGKGGMGVVYKAEHRVMGRPVALKVINQKLVRNKTAVDRFQLEVRAAAKLSHPNIVTAHDADQAGDVHFLVMEFVDGADVATQVGKTGPLPIRHACHFARQAALGLQHAHEMGAVHRDIKPQNLMIARDGRLKILDFGLARLASEADVDSEAAKLTKDGVMLGTPDYMAPEQILDCRQADIRADIYGLGAALYFMLAGHPPFPGGSAVDKMQAQLKQQPDDLSSLREDVPDDLIAVIAKMMTKDLAERYQSPAEVAAALRPYCQASPAVAAPVAAESEARAEPDPLDLPLAEVPAPRPAPRQPASQPGRVSRVPRAALIATGLALGLLLASVATWALFQVFSGGDSHRILVVVPFNNFWGPDYYNVRHHLDDAGFQVDVASSQRGSATPSPDGQIFQPVDVDLVLSAVDESQYSAVIFTGAWPTSNLEFTEDAGSTTDAGRVIREMLQSGKHVTAICGGTTVLGASGSLDGQRAAWNDYLPEDLKASAAIQWVYDQPAVVSDKIITARSDADARDFVDTLRERLR